MSHGIGRVLHAAEPAFEHAHLRAALLEDKEGERGLRLKKSGRSEPPLRDAREGADNFFERGCKDAGVCGSAVHGKALGIGQHGGRGEDAGAMVRLPKDGGKHGAHRTFAVGAGDMDDTQGVVGRSELVEQRAGARRPVGRDRSAQRRKAFRRFCVKQKAPPGKRFRREAGSEKCTASQKALRPRAPPVSTALNAQVSTTSE